MISLSVVVSAVLGCIAATTARGAALVPRQAITPLSASTIASYKPYTYFASSAYCAPKMTLSWSCGGNCQANSGFQPVASGGDGSDVPYWYVGFDTVLNTVIVAHEGTNPSSLISDLTDADFFLEPLSASLFPGLPSSVEVHSGFAASQAGTATLILSAVENAMSTSGTTSVTIVGHSSGAAIGLIDSVYLPLHLPSGTTFKTIGYGLPRVGNQAFADYVDAHLHLTHINNKEDPIPILPGMFLGFVHPAGEVHIEDSGEWANCPGQDNPSTQCIVGDVPNIFEGNVQDHSGPYDGVIMGC